VTLHRSIFAAYCFEKIFKNKQHTRYYYYNQQDVETSWYYFICVGEQIMTNHVILHVHIFIINSNVYVGDDSECSGTNG